MTILRHLSLGWAVKVETAEFVSEGVLIIY